MCTLNVDRKKDKFFFVVECCLLRGEDDGTKVGDVQPFIPYFLTVTYPNHLG